MINQSRGCFLKKTRTATTTRTDASLCVERIHVTEIIHVTDEEIKDDTICLLQNIYLHTHLYYMTLQLNFWHVCQCVSQ